jgi:hypothetical protein
MGESRTKTRRAIACACEVPSRLPPGIARTQIATREGEGGPPLALVAAIINPGATLSEIDGEHHDEVSLPLDID